MCVLYDTNDLKYGGEFYKVKGIITAYWIHGHWTNPSIACRDSHE